VSTFSIAFGQDHPSTFPPDDALWSSSDGLHSFRLLALDAGADPTGQCGDSGTVERTFLLSRRSVSGVDGAPTASRSSALLGSHGVSTRRWPICLKDFSFLAADYTTMSTAVSLLLELSSRHTYSSCSKCPALPLFSRCGRGRGWLIRPTLYLQVSFPDRVGLSSCPETTHNTPDRLS